MAYDPKTDVVTDLGFALKGNGLITMAMDPQRETGVPVHRAYWETEQTFTVVAHSGDRKKIYFLETGSSYLVEYEPHRRHEGKMTFLDQICADRYRGKRGVPYATISFCCGPDNVIYYLHNSAVAEEEGSPYWGGSIAASLITFDLNTRERKDWRLVQVEEGLTVLHANAASASADGTIYFVAYVLELRKRAEHFRHAGQSYALRLLIHRPESSR